MKLVIVTFRNEQGTLTQVVTIEKPHLAIHEEITKTHGTYTPISIITCDHIEFQPLSCLTQFQNPCK